MKTIDVPSTHGVTIRLHHFGGSGSPLLICHATGFHGRAYTPLARQLMETYDVWALDFRGHGASTAPLSEDFAWDGMADDLLACIATIDRGPVFAVGHSMGGAAILLASVVEPTALRAAYVFEPVVLPADMRTTTDSPISRAARRRRSSFESREAVIVSYGSRPPLNELHPDSLEAYVEFGFVDGNDGNVHLSCDREHESLTFEGATVTPELISSSDLPVLVGMGETAEDFSPAHLAPGIAELLPKAALREYPELGHFGPLQDPARIADDIRHWFASR